METMAKAAQEKQAPEVTEKAKRRRFSAAEKLRITTDPESGESIDHGPASDYVPKGEPSKE